MPFLSEDELRRLTGDAAPVDAVLDLGDQPRGEAMLQVESMLADARTGAPRRIALRYTPASPGGGETLFLPLGRRLLEARKRGLVAHFTPLPNGDGFIVTLPGGA
jgi:hypothetical protein